MVRFSMFVALLTMCLGVASSASQAEEAVIQIPIAGWNVKRLDDLKLTPIRVNVTAKEIRLVVEFADDVPTYELSNLKRKLNQNPITVTPYSLALINAEKKVKTLQIGTIQDEITGHKGDRFDILFVVPKGLAAFNPEQAELRAP